MGSGMGDMWKVPILKAKGKRERELLRKVGANQQKGETGSFSGLLLGHQTCWPAPRSVKKGLGP